MKTTIFYFFTLTIIASSCKANHVLVKFKNDSNEDFKNIYINILGKKFILDSLKQGQTSHNLIVDKSYRYCLILAETPSDTLTHWYIDFVGERLFTNGRLVMKLSIKADENKKRHLEIITKRPFL